MTAGRIDGPGRTVHAEGVDGAQPDASSNEGDPSVVLEGGDRRPIEQTTSASRQPDGDLGRIAGTMAFLADPMVMQLQAQRLLRDSQNEIQEQGIEIQNDRATEAAQTRMEALLDSIAKAKDAEGWAVFAQVAIRVAAVAGAIAGCVAGAFTGGAGVVLAAGLIIMAFGADLGLALKECGVDADVTNAIGIGTAAVGTVCTLGAASAGAAGGAAASAGAAAAQSAAQTAAQTAQGVARAVEIGARVYAASGQIISGVYEHEAAYARADSESADVEANAALDLMEEHVDEAIAFMESYERVVTRLRGAAEAQDEAMRAATARRA